MNYIKNNRWIMGFVIIALIFVGWIYYSRNNLIAISSSDVWNPSGTEWIAKWQKCENIDCNLDLMKQNSSSMGARNFVKFLSERGYLKEFREMGKVDLGTVVFPDRANNNEEYYLLNGFPIIISTNVSEDELTLDGGGPRSAVEKDPLFNEMYKKYPKITLWETAKEFIEKKSLSNNDEEYIFKYDFVNDCHSCNTEYFAKIGFIFNQDGEYIGPEFLQIELK